MSEPEPIGLTAREIEIDLVLIKLREAWHKNPELRLGQLIFNAAWSAAPGYMDDGSRVFNVVDEEIAESLTHIAEAGW